MGLVICKDCHSEKPHYAYGICHSCYNVRWNKANPDKHNSYERNRRIRLGSVYAEKERERNQTQKRKEWKREYYLSHKAYFAKKQSEYRTRNKDKVAARWEEWHKVNHVKRREYSLINGAKRRSIKRGLPSTLTPDQWNAIKAAYKNRCAYCGKLSLKLCQDHFIPVAKGGGYTPENIVPACRRCNSAKCDRAAPKDVPVRLMI